jgi:selenide,water dikinase
MASGSNKTIEIYTDSVPKLEGALDFAAMGILPEGMYNNLYYLDDKVIYINKLPQNRKDLIFDPQTSGGLLISISEKNVQEYLSRMEVYTPWVKVIGKVVDKREKSILIY